MKLNPSFAAGYASPCGVGFRKVVKCTIMIKKKAGMSDEDFVAYYNTRHARMATEVVVRYRCIMYSLVSRYHSHRSGEDGIIYWMGMGDASCGVRRWRLTRRKDI